MRTGTEEKRVAACVLIMVAAVSTMTAGTGCSLMFVHGPPEPRSPGMGASTDCTTSVALPVLDTVLSAYLLLNMIVNINRPASSFGMNGEAVKSGSIAFGATFTGLAAASAGVGYSRVSACKDYLYGQDDWTPAPRPRRRVPPPPRAPVPSEPAPSPPVWPAPGSVPGAPAAEDPAAQPARVPVTVPPGPAVPAEPAPPATSPAPQMEDDEVPRPGRPRSLLVLPATLPMLAAMPRLDEKSPPSTAPRFADVPGFAHPWHVVAASAVR